MYQLYLGLELSHLLALVAQKNFLRLFQEALLGVCIFITLGNEPKFDFNLQFRHFLDRNTVTQNDYF